MSSIINKSIVKVFRHLVVLTALLMSTSSGAEQFAIVVNANNNEAIEISDVERIYLGKKGAADSRFEGKPIHLPRDNRLFKAFSKKVLGKTPSQLRAYWAKRIFTGKGRPPDTVSSQSELVEILTNNLNAIGYMNMTKVSPQLRIITTVDF